MVGKKVRAAFETGDDPEELREWYRKSCPNGKRNGLNPLEFEIGDVNDILAKIKGEKAHMQDTNLPLLCNANIAQK